MPSRQTISLATTSRRVAASDDGLGTIKATFNSGHHAGKFLELKASVTDGAISYNCESDIQASQRPSGCASGTATAVSSPAATATTKGTKLAKAAVDAEFAEALRIAKEKQAAEAAAEAERLAAENAAKLAQAKKRSGKSQLMPYSTTTTSNFKKKKWGE